MSERRIGGPDGIRVRRVHMRPGVMVEMVPPGGQKVLDQEAERAKKAAALGAARGFFTENAQDIAYLNGGAVEDRDNIPAEGLRSVTLGLMEAGLGSDDAVREVVRSLRERPFGDTNTTYSMDAARAYGRLLSEERERVLEERVAVEGSSKPTARTPRAPRS